MAVEGELGGDPGISQEDLDILDGPDPGGDDETIAGGTEEEETPETPASEETPEPEEAPPGEEPPGEVTEPGEEETEEKEVKETPPEPKPGETVTAKAIQVKYPNFFKEFPDVRGAIFRDRQFREFIPTPEDARELVERNQDFTDYERTVQAGDPTLLFKSLADSPEMLGKFSMNILPTIEKFSPELRGKMIYPYVRRIFANALNDAQQSGNKNLVNSVGHMAKYLWNSNTIPADESPHETKENPEVTQLREENEALQARQSEAFASRIVDTGVANLRRSVEFSFKDDKRFSPIEKKALINDIVTQTRATLDRNPQHVRAMKSLWIKARSNGLPEQLIPRLVSTFLGGAKSALPAVRARIVASALKEKGITPPAKGQQTGSPRTGGPIKGGKAISSKDIDYRTTSDADILSDDPEKIKLKRR